MRLSLALGILLADVANKAVVTAECMATKDGVDLGVIDGSSVTCDGLRKCSRATIGVCNEVQCTAVFACANADIDATTVTCNDFGSCENAEIDATTVTCNYGGFYASCGSADIDATTVTCDDSACARADINATTVTCDGFYSCFRASMTIKEGGNLKCLGDEACGLGSVGSIDAGTATIECSDGVTGKEACPDFTADTVQAGCVACDTATYGCDANCRFTDTTNGDVDTQCKTFDSAQPGDSVAKACSTGTTAKNCAQCNNKHESGGDAEECCTSQGGCEWKENASIPRGGTCKKA